MGIQKIYPKCVVEGCGRNVIWEQTYNKYPLCPNCTKMLMVFKWIMENIRYETKNVHEATAPSFVVTPTGISIEKK